jgi:hypothetical protein
MNDDIDESINSSLLHIPDSINVKKVAGYENDEENFMNRDYLSTINV